MTTKKEAIQKFRSKLSSDKRWAIKGMLTIYDRQTSEERASHNTIEHNKIGYSGAHAEIMTSFSKQYQRKGYLSPKQMKIVFKIMPKYARQLYEVAKSQGNV